MKKLLLFALILIFCFSVHANPAEKLLEYSNSFTVDYDGSLKLKETGIELNFWNLPENYSHELKAENGKLMPKTDIGFPLNLDLPTERKITILYGFGTINYNFQIYFEPDSDKKTGKIILIKNNNEKQEFIYSFIERETQTIRTKYISFSVKWISFHPLSPTADIVIKDIVFEEELVKELTAVLINAGIEEKVKKIKKNINSFGKGIRAIDLEDPNEFVLQKTESLPLQEENSEIKLHSVYEVNEIFIKKISGYALWGNGINFDGDTKENYNHLLVLKKGKPLLLIYIDDKDRWHLKTVRKEFQDEKYLGGFEILKTDFESVNAWGGWEETEELKPGNKKYAEAILKTIGIQGTIDLVLDAGEFTAETWEKIPVGGINTSLFTAHAIKEFFNIKEKFAYLMSYLEPYAGTGKQVIFNGKSYSLKAISASKYTNATKVPINEFMVSAEIIGNAKITTNAAGITEITTNIGKAAGTTIKAGTALTLLAITLALSIPYEIAVDLYDSTSVFSGNTAETIMIWDEELFSTWKDKKITQLIIRVPLQKDNCILVDEFIDEKGNKIDSELKQKIIKNMDSIEHYYGIGACKLPEQEQLWICMEKEANYKELNFVSKVNGKEYSIEIKEKENERKTFPEQYASCWTESDTV
ncbi:MAG: hypothetical protein JW703_00565 [Candidatus Diapherotrites archaeon]|nr:hypothetical protein [Candidatus Diapherotrites archaeon]